MSKIQILRVIGFVIFFLIIFMYFQTVFSSRFESAKENMEIFYRERKNSVDAVYIGASPVHRYWHSEVAYRQNGLVVLNYSYCGQSAQILKYLIKEVYKYQHPQLILIDIRAFSIVEQVQLSAVHAALNYIPYSINKLQILNEFCKNYKIQKPMEYIFPIIKFHERWKKLKMDDFFKSSKHYKSHLPKEYFEIIPKHYKNIIMTEDESPVDEKTELLFLDLLFYLKNNKISAIFINSPYILTNGKDKINYLLKMANSFGFDTIDFNKPNIYNELKINMDEDWTEEFHVNIRGAIKYTNYFSKFLKEEYNLPDRRNKKGYESWDRAWEEYKKELQKYDIDVYEVINEQEKSN